ncbi:MAG TPA: HEPN domain-containing protein [Anaerolineales bacterium]|nr:HEPN domain-containing protein [Anaerolineales bacterium]
MKFPKGFDADKYTALLWKRAVSDLKAAESIIEERERFGFGLFFVHGSLQKMIAANICHQTHSMPPWRYDLTKLAKIANISLSKEQKDFCKIMNFYHKEGLYLLELQHPIPSKEQARNYVQRAKELAASLPNPLAK